MEPLCYMNQRRVGPSRPFQQSYNKPYFNPFGNQFMQSEWVPIGQGSFPNNLSFLWQNTQTQQGQGTSFQFHPTAQFSSYFPLTNWRPQQQPALVPPPTNPVQNKQPLRPPPMPAQPAPNPNNRQVQPVYNNEMDNFRAYSLDTVEVKEKIFVQGIHSRIHHHLS